ncbi:MAG: hypothetical protein BJ554DRAFT_6411 [Olpidium bornovanus]|uniref:Uncharacterized protein n=1 Tax=Olpidium bornovanus TaxID=278681 RepID=A0A8H7ZY24_9FUNG|nr:MAG: hypothetical protein BJ554DRAFT_6411 [Olpidium bornovanus]
MRWRLGATGFPTKLPLNSVRLPIAWMPWTVSLAISFSRNVGPGCRARE